MSSLVVLWLGLGAFTTVALDLIPGWGTKIQSKKLNMKQTLTFAETVWMGHSVLPLIWADARTKL